MANGSSTVSMLDVLQGAGDGHVTSIDPFQLAPVAPPPGGIPGYAGEGVRAVQDAGFAARHTLIAEPDYLALPKLVAEGRQFDFIFIDGYHAFDYAMLDLFYADLLLKPGCLVVLHDSNRPTVFTACQFLAHNKAYTMIGPPLMLSLGTRAARAARKAWHLASGRAPRFEPRRTRWKSLAAFRKVCDGLADEVVLKGL